MFKKQELKYTVTYVVGDGRNVAQTIEDGHVYNALTDGEVTLNDPIPPEGAEFMCWYYRQDHLLEEENYETSVPCTTLPRTYDENIIHLTTGGLNLTLYAEFSYAKLDIDFVFVTNAKSVNDVNYSNTQNYKSNISVAKLLIYSDYKSNFQDFYHNLPDDRRTVRIPL